MRHLLFMAGISQGGLTVKQIAKRYEKFRLAQKEQTQVSFVIHDKRTDAVVLALTMGSLGEEGRKFIDDVKQASIGHLGSAFIGGIIFNAANILLVAAIDIAGMAIAFPIGIGLALVVGIVSTYLVDPTGNITILSLGIASIIIAVILVV